MNMFYITLIAIIIVSLLAIVYIIYYNKLQDAKLKIDEAERIIDENLRAKYDVIVNMKKLIKKTLRNAKINFKDIDEVKDIDISNFDFDRKLTDYISIIDSVINDYKKVQEKQEIYTMLNDIKKIDERLTSAKEFYNKYITESNELVLKFPSNIIALIHNIKQKNYFDNKDLTDEVINDFKL